MWEDLLPENANLYRFGQASDMLQVSMGSMALSHPIARPRPGSDNGHLTTFRRGRRISTMPPHRLRHLFRPARASSNAVLLDAEWSRCLDPTCRTPHVANAFGLLGGGRDHRGVASDVASPAGTGWVERGPGLVVPKRQLTLRPPTLQPTLDLWRWSTLLRIDHVEPCPVAVACSLLPVARSVSPPALPPPNLRCARLKVVKFLLRGFSQICRRSDAREGVSVALRLRSFV